MLSYRSEWLDGAGSMQPHVWDDQWELQSRSKLRASKPGPAKLAFLRLTWPCRLGPNLLPIWGLQEAVPMLVCDFVFNLCDKRKRNLLGASNWVRHTRRNHDRCDPNRNLWGVILLVPELVWVTAARGLNSLDRGMWLKSMNPTLG